MVSKINSSRKVESVLYNDRDWMARMTEQTDFDLLRYELNRNDFTRQSVGIYSSVWMSSSAFYTENGKPKRANIILDTYEGQWVIIDFMKCSHEDDDYILESFDLESLTPLEAKEYLMNNYKNHKKESELV